MTEERRQKILKIVNLATRLNETPTRQELTGKKPTVFIDICGHTASAYISIHSNGYANGVYDDETVDIPFDKEIKRDPYCTGNFELAISADKLADEVVARIEELCKQWGVDISE